MSGEGLFDDSESVLSIFDADFHSVSSGGEKTRIPRKNVKRTAGRGRSSFTNEFWGKNKICISVRTENVCTFVGSSVRPSVGNARVGNEGNAIFGQS